jgi:hypothetical protein
LFDNSIRFRDSKDVFNPVAKELSKIEDEIEKFKREIGG